MASVHYENKMRVRAKQQRKFLVTVSVDGRDIGDQSCTVQRLADLKMAKRVAKFAVALLKAEVADVQPKR